jgi:hypothetical protein
MKKIKLKVIGAKDFYIVPEQFLDIKEIVGKKLKPVKAKIIGAKDFYIISEVFLPEGINPIDFIGALVSSWENPNPALYNFYSFGENPSPFSYLKRKILYSPILVLNIAYNPNKVIPRVFKTGTPIYSSPFYSHFFPRVKLIDMTRWVQEGKKQAKIKFIYSFKTLPDKFFNLPNDDVKVGLDELTTNEALLDYTQGKFSDKITLKVYPTGDFQDNDQEVWIYEIYVSPQDVQPVKWIHLPIEYTANADWVDQIIDENTGRTWTKGVNWPPSWNDEDFGDRTGTLVGRESEGTFSNIHTFRISRLTTDEEGYVRVRRQISAKVHSFYYTVLLPINRQETFEYLHSTDPTNRPLWFNKNDIINREYLGYYRFENVSIPFEAKDYVDTIDKNYNNRIKVKCRGGKFFNPGHGHPYYDVAYSSLQLPNLSSTNYVFLFPPHTTFDNNGSLTLTSFNVIYTRDRIFEIDLQNKYFRQYQGAYRSYKMGPYTWDAFTDTNNNRRVIRIRYLYPSGGTLKREGIVITAPPLAYNVGWVSVAGIGKNKQEWIIHVYNMYGTDAYIILATLDMSRSPAIEYYSIPSTSLFAADFFGDLPDQDSWTFFLIKDNTFYRIFSVFRTLFISSITFSSLSSIRKIVNINGRNMGLIDWWEDIKFMRYSYPPPSMTEYEWRRSGGTEGNINKGLTGTYDGSGNIKLFSSISNSIPGYGSFGDWGGRLIWTKDHSSSSSSYSFSSLSTITLDEGLPDDFTLTFSQFDSSLAPANEGYFSWLPNT